MKAFGIIILFFMTYALCENFTEENNVTVLTDDNFNKAIEQYDDVLVLFYAPWCGHCQKFKPEYEKAASLLKDQKTYILAKVDATVNKKLAEKYKIRAYPTVKLIKNGEEYRYSGGRKTDEVVKWMRKNSGIFYRILNTTEQLEDFKNSGGACVVYFGKKKEDLHILSQVAMDNNFFPYAAVFDEELIKNNTKEGSVVLFKKYDELKDEINTFTEKELHNFIRKNWLPKVMEIDEQTMTHIFLQQFPAIIIFADKDKKEKWDEYNKLMKDLHDQITDKNLQPFVTEMKHGLAQKIGQFIGVKESELPTVRIIDNTNDLLKKYIMTGEVNEKNILAFADDYSKGKLQKFIKSQKEPTENKDAVFEVVGTTFKKEVLDNDKDVLVLFYAPWCGHCQAFKPIYEEVAKLLKEKNPKLLLVKIDASENDAENIQIIGYPTLKFFPGNKKREQPVDYTLERTKENVIKFLKENCYHKLVYEEEKKEEKKEGKKETDL